MSFEHHRDTGMRVLSAIQRLSGEYRALIEQPELKSLNTGTSYLAGKARPTWLDRLTNLHDSLEQQLVSARGGANK
jgi:hypothetical protein